MVRRVRVSALRAQESDDPRNQLWQHYLDYVRLWQPKVFLMENVPGFRREFANFAQAVEAELNGRYRLFSRRFITQYYCVPQFRDRLIIQGIRKDVASGPSWPKPTAAEVFSYTKSFATAITMRDALEDLGPPGHAGPQPFADHCGIELRESDASIAVHVPNGGSLKDIPDPHLPPPYQGREANKWGLDMV